jgi:protein SCO1/2
MAAFGLCIWEASPAWHGGASRWPTALVLRSADGPVSLDTLRGKVSLLYFGYTFCPSTCPLTLSEIGRALHRLDASQKRDVQGLFVSVDPARDTPARLKAYAAFFDPSIVAMTGSMSALRALANAFDAPFEKHDGASDYEIDHASAVYLLDHDGRLFETIDDASDDRRVVDAILRAKRSR